MYADMKFKSGKHYYYGYYDWLTRRNVIIFDFAGTEELFPKPVAITTQDGASVMG
jgi:hypothetical protein